MKLYANFDNGLTVSVDSTPPAKNLVEFKLTQFHETKQIQIARCLISKADAIEAFIECLVAITIDSNFEREEFTQFLQKYAPAFIPIIYTATITAKKGVDTSTKGE
jgi:hypothetical protein